MPDDLFWRCTTGELNALLDALREREERRDRAAWRRAALICAQIFNAHRTKPSDRVWTPDDFISEPVRELTPEQMESMLDAMLRPSRKRHEA
ncbi:MAG: phage tail assembly protein T [Gemmatimonadota bacterium]